MVMFSNIGGHSPKWAVESVWSKVQHCLPHIVLKEGSVARLALPIINIFNETNVGKRKSDIYQTFFPTCSDFRRNSFSMRYFKGSSKNAVCSPNMKTSRLPSKSHFRS